MTIENKNFVRIAALLISHRSQLTSLGKIAIDIVANVVVARYDSQQLSP